MISAKGLADTVPQVVALKHHPAKVYIFGETVLLLGFAGLVAFPP